MTIFKSMFWWRLVKHCISVALSLLILSTNASFALDYVIKEVIEIGEADFVPFLGPVKWSPDGSQLAFIKNGILKISDTLGNVREVGKLDMAPHSFDWVSENQIAVSMRAYPGPSINTEEKLVLMDTQTGRITSVHEFTTSPGYRKEPGKTTSSGPYKTAEGSNYYLFTTYNSKSGNTVVEKRAFSQNKSESIKNDHILNWGDDGLYMVTLDGRDSVRLTEKPTKNIIGPTYINKERTHILMRNLIISLVDSSRISLRSKIGPPAPNTVVCGTAWYSFNPVVSEVLFTITCDDGDNYIVNRLGLYDFKRDSLTVIDSAVGISHCEFGEYSPKGNDVAFFANGKVYILNREKR